MVETAIQPLILGWCLRVGDPSSKILPHFLGYVGELRMLGSSLVIPDRKSKREILQRMAQAE